MFAIDVPIDAVAKKHANSVLRNGDGPL